MVSAAFLFCTPHAIFQLASRERDVEMLCKVPHTRPFCWHVRAHSPFPWMQETHSLNLIETPHNPPTGERTIYMTLEQGGEYTQDTFVGHLWLVFAGETNIHACTGPQTPATIEIHPLGEHASALPTACKKISCDPASYAERERAVIKSGYVGIMAFGCVKAKALDIAARTVEKMLQDAAPSVCQRLVARRVTLAVIGRRQVTSDMKPYSFLEGDMTYTYILICTYIYI